MSAGDFDFVCGKCDRRQSYAPEGISGGVTIAEAKAIGWTENDLLRKWLCPFCSGNEAKLAAVFAQQMRP